MLQRHCRDGGSPKVVLWRYRHRSDESQIPTSSSLSFGRPLFRKQVYPIEIGTERKATERCTFGAIADLRSVIASSLVCNGNSIEIHEGSVGPADRVQIGKNNLGDFLAFVGHFLV